MRLDSLTTPFMVCGSVFFTTPFMVCGVVLFIILLSLSLILEDTNDFSTSKAPQ